MPVSASETRAFLDARRAARAGHLQAHRAALEEALGIAVQVLSGLGARRVVLFGSLLRQDLHEQSDLDLAVEGLSPRLLVEALAQIWLRTSVGVDLVALESAPPSLRERVRAEGREVWSG